MAALAQDVFRFDVAEVVQSRKAVLTEVVHALDAVLANSELVADKHQFGGFFDRVVTLLELSDDELASLMLVSRPTVGRWKRGDAAPHPLARASVFEALRRVARKKLP